MKLASNNIVAIFIKWFLAFSGFLVIPSCAKNHDPHPWFADIPCSTFYTTPGGIIWSIYGPTLPNNLNVDNPPDGIYTIDPLTISLAIDAGVSAVQVQYPDHNVWGIARRLTWQIVNDYVFPDPDAVDGTTGYATGSTISINNYPIGVVFALWTRHDLPDGVSEPDPTTLIAPWTLLGPGIDGYNNWRYGDFPMLPALGYEFRVNVLHVASN